MTIDKAIEIQTIHNDHNPNFTDAEGRQAHQLGIEALIRVQLHRKALHCSNQTLLPGETPSPSNHPSHEELKRLQESPLGREPRV